MRIAFISSEYSGLPGSGGIGTYFHQAVLCLSRLGHEIEVFTSGLEGDLPTIDRVTYIHLGSDHPKLFPLNAAIALRVRHQQVPFDILEYAELKAEGLLASEIVPDIVRVVRIHSPSIILNRYLDIRRSKRRILVDLLQNLRAIAGAFKAEIPIPPIAFEPVHFPWPTGADADERKAVDSADLVIVMNDKMKNFVIKHWWINSQKIVKVANPLILKNNGQDKAPASSINSKTIGFAGRLEPRKGLVELSQALCGVLPKYPEWKVEVFGRDSPSCISGKSSLQIAQVNLKNFTNRVMFNQEASHQDVISWLPSLDIFVFPSLWDNFPYALLEAMAAGCAIIASDTGAVPEMLGSAGILVPTGDVGALRRALDSLMKDSTKRDRLGRLAQQRYQSAYAPSEVVSDMVRVYQIAIEKATKSPRS